LYIWGFLLFSVFFFKVNSGVFLHNRVATLYSTSFGRLPRQAGMVQCPVQTKQNCKI